MARVSIEDCLNHLDNRFCLVLVAADRTRQIMHGNPALVKTKNREAVTALREIAEGLIVPQMVQSTQSTDTVASTNQLSSKSSS